MRTKPAYRDYERRRLGHRGRGWAGHVYMVRRSFGAPSFAGFWRHWNPLFGYYLYYCCYRPLARGLPRSLAVLITFGLSGGVHDFFASVALARMVVLFTPAFVGFGLLVVAEERIGWSLRWMPIWLRVSVHGAILTGTIALCSLWL